MILDSANPQVFELGGRRYSIFDFHIIDDATGDVLNAGSYKSSQGPWIIYADDKAGFYRHYKCGLSGNGIRYLDIDQDTHQLIVCEVHRKIRIAPRPGTGTRIHRQPTDHAVT